MRTVPADVSINPMPDGYTVAIADISSPSQANALLKATAFIHGQRYELGLRPPRDDASIADATAMLTLGVWQLNEFARIGRPDLMAYASVNRHKSR
jgi:hypothetical protein